MARLVGSDYRKVLEVLYALGEAGGGALQEPVLRALRELVPCDVVAYHENSMSDRRVIIFTGEPVGAMSPKIRAAHRQLQHEDPLRPAVGAAKLTDLVSVREFRRRDFYQQVHRPLGIEYMLWLYLDPRTTDARLDFDRADRDFSERDRTVLNLLSPHLAQHLRAARTASAASPDVQLTAREREVITHVAQGRTNGEVATLLGVSTETVRKHLENLFAKLGVHTRTAAVAAVYRSNQTRWPSRDLQ